MVPLVMAERGEVRIEVTFGPSRAPSLPRAISLAREHAERVVEGEDGTYRVTYLLHRDRSAYLHASVLVGMVTAWRSTTITCDGEPVDAGAIRAMLACAADWLAQGRCQAWFPTGSHQAKCRSCPLYDREWAYEASGRIDPSWALVDGVLIAPEVPAFVPPEWSEPPDELSAS
jgi:hypothetical protein